MLRKLRLRRPGHAAIVAYLALFAALGTTAAYTVAPPAAIATVTSSALTQPADGTRLIYDDQSPPATVHVAGTTNGGASSDSVQLLCDRGPNQSALSAPTSASRSTGPSALTSR